MWIVQAAYGPLQTTTRPERSEPPGHARSTGGDERKVACASFRYAGTWRAPSSDPHRPQRRKDPCQRRLPCEYNTIHCNNKLTSLLVTKTGDNGQM